MKISLLLRSQHEPPPVLQVKQFVPLHATCAATPRAAALFRQGLLLRYGFNSDEARRNFLASAASGDCAMCMWGVASSLLPDVNNWWGCTR